MKKWIYLIGAILLAAFFAMIDPAELHIDISFVAISAFVMIATLIILFFRAGQKLRSISMKKKDYFFAILFGFCMTLGYGLIRGHGFDVFFKSNITICISIAAFVFYTVFGVYLLKYLYAAVDNWMDKSETEVQPKGRFLGFIFSKIKENKLGFYFVAIAIMWLPAFILHFPGMLMYDSVIQMSMYYGIPNNHTDASILIDSTQFVTMHHSVIHTFMVGWLMDLGQNVFGTIEAGIFIYALIQFVFVALAVAYMFKSIQEYLGIRWTFIFLLILGLHPFFGTCAVLLTKDVYFCVFFILYMVKYYECVRNPELMKDKSFFVKFLMLTIGLILFRNNALYTVILISMTMFIFMKVKKQVILYVVLFMAFNIGYSNYLMPALGISPGSIREMLSVPFQQTANYINQYGDEVTEREKEVISNIIDYETILTQYDPEKSDPIKDTYNKYATTDDLKEYIVVWFEMLCKHPDAYVEAFLHQTYGYYFPSVKDSITYDCYNDYHARKKGIEVGLPLADAVKPNIIDNIYYGGYLVLANSPFLCLFNDTGIFIWVWVFAFLYIMHRFMGDRKRYLLYYVPYIAYIVFILVGPVNGTIYFRYMMPYMFALPMMFLPFFEYKKEKKR